MDVTFSKCNDAINDLAAIALLDSFTASPSMPAYEHLMDQNTLIFPMSTKCIFECKPHSYTIHNNVLRVLELPPPPSTRFKPHDHFPIVHASDHITQPPLVTHVLHPRVKIMNV